MGTPAPPDGWPASASAAAHVFVAALDDAIDVDGPDGHHLQRVRRLHPGERVTAAVDDGEGRWREYDVADVAPGRLRLAAAGPVRRQPPPRPPVAVAVALTKGGGLDDVVAGCTELGVTRIEPVRSERSVVRWDDARATAAVERWRDIAREAAMQCRRATVPVVAPVLPLAALAGRPGLVVADRAGTPAATLAEPGDAGWLVVVGPEGGLAPDEVEQLGTSARVCVGRYVLRAQTAPLAVVAALVARTTGVFDVVN